MVGLARALAVDPDFPRKVLNGEDVVSSVHALETGIAAIDHTGTMEVAWYARELHRMGRGDAPQPNESARRALLGVVSSMGWGTLRTRLRG